MRSASDAQRVAERVKSRFIAATDRALGAYATWSMRRTPESLQMIIDTTAWREATRPQTDHLIELWLVGRCDGYNWSILRSARSGCKRRDARPQV